MTALLEDRDYVLWIGTRSGFDRLKREEHRLHIDITVTILMDSFPGPYGQVLSNLVINAVVHAFDGRKHGEMWLKADLLNDKQVRLIFSDNPKNLSWTGSSVRFSAFLARRDDATSKLIGGTTKSRSAEKWAIEFVAVSPKW